MGEIGWSKAFREVVASLNDKTGTVPAIICFLFVYKVTCG